MVIKILLTLMSFSVLSIFICSCWITFDRLRLIKLRKNITMKNTSVKSVKKACNIICDDFVKILDEIINNSDLYFYKDSEADKYINKKIVTNYFHNIAKNIVEKNLISLVLLKAKETREEDLKIIVCSELLDIVASSKLREIYDPVEDFMQKELNKEIMKLLSITNYI